MTDFFQQVIKKNFADSQVISSSPISGGCINNTVKIVTDNGQFFLKWNKAEYESMFSNEKQGLDLLLKKSPLFTPTAIDFGVLNDRAYLLTEWIETGVQSNRFWESFAENLANQHKSVDVLFGLNHNNYIGSLPQSNKQHHKWSRFFIEERIVPQLKLAESKKLINKEYRHKFDKLFRELDSIIPNEHPSLLHGDLWSGNFMCGKDGDAVIFDPAIYYGHRETELAFTHLFGGFSQVFYEAYQAISPMESGFENRFDIHNLYPLLVHVNLFGTSYLSGVSQTLQRFT
ncbi:fructosamine kinase family protein [Ekhidna sp.]